MFTGTNNRSQWLVALPAPMAFAAFALFVWAMAKAGLGMQLLTATATAAMVFLHYLAVERTRARDRERMLALLRVLNRPGDLHGLIREITGFMQIWTGCGAVGVRLQESDDFPYFETRGFSKEFVLAERHLCVRDPAGEAVRDSVGDPVLECMCGNILRGQFDPSMPFFTAKGSFFSNSSR